PSLGKVRKFFQKRLPPQKGPPPKVVLDAPPKNGPRKLDHPALPTPPPLDPPTPSRGGAARPPLWGVVGRIWGNVLKREQVGVHDDFFLNGGDSLLALQLIHEINTAFGLELPVRLLFDEPTAAGQASEIERTMASRNQQRERIYAPVVPLRPG